MEVPRSTRRPQPVTPARTLHAGMGGEALGIKHDVSASKDSADASFFALNHNHGLTAFKLALPLVGLAVCQATQFHPFATSWQNAKTADSESTRRPR
jgi:hypothetical protein